MTTQIPLAAAQYAAKSASFTAAVGYTYEVDCTNGAVTCTLPTATAGASIRVKKTDSTYNPVTIVGTIDGTVQSTLGFQYQTETVIGNGLTWGRYTLKITDQIGIHIPSGWGQFWKSGRDGAGSALCTVAMIGDSLTQGLYASDLYATSWPGLLRTRQQALYGDGGTGFIGTKNSVIGSTEYSNTPWALTGTWTSSALPDGPGGYSLTSSVDASTATCSFRGTAIIVFWLRDPSAGTFTVTIDGVSKGSVNTAGGAGVLTSTFGGLSSASHTLVITKTGTSPIYLCGAQAGMTSGIRVNNFGKGGSTAADWGASSYTYGSPALWSGGSSFQSHLCIIGLGINDSAASTSTDTYASQMRNIVDNIKDTGTRNGATDLLFVMHHLGTHSDPINVYSDYCARIRGLADTYGAGYINLWAYLRNSRNYATALNYWGDSANPGGVGTNSVHLSDPGEVIVANIISAVLESV